MSGKKTVSPWFARSRRRMLVDMHIPDWDPAFLSRYDPAAAAADCRRAGLDAVMFYCQSHVGLCYWPTETGTPHAGMGGRDFVGEMLAELRRLSLPAVAYYSVVFNNRAFLDHPEWRPLPVSEETGDAVFAGSRYGFCCPNNPGYRAFVAAQVRELLGRYRFDGAFFDMTFWPVVCRCDACGGRFRREVGGTIPTVVDWLDPAWCTFADTRQAWMAEFVAFLTETAKAASPGVTVYHNFATAPLGWRTGLDFSGAVHHDYLGADFYGDRVEQLVVSSLMDRLSRNRPVEFMTSCCVNLRDHARLKSEREMLTQAFAATLFSSAMLFIDAVNPDGTTTPGVFDRVGRVYARTAAYEPWLGGEPVEDVAVCFSDSSKMSFGENGLPVAKAGAQGFYPHLAAVRGACRALQRAHIPFGIATRRDLGDLGGRRLLVLPDVLRMSPEEADAVRRYVAAGGALYASGYTSLTETSGRRPGDFLLADVFGCSFDGEIAGGVAYFTPADPAIAAAVFPQKHLSRCPSSVEGSDPSAASVLRLKPGCAARVLATLCLPYAAPAAGSVFDQRWASIHSSPPWEETGLPAVVVNRFGAGTAVYAASAIEVPDAEANERVFLRLVRMLLGDRPCSHESDAPPWVWIRTTVQENDRRFLVSFLDGREAAAAGPVPPFRFRIATGGRRCAAFRRLPDLAPIPFSDDGAFEAEVPGFDLFSAFIVEWAGPEAGKPGKRGGEL